MSENGSAKGSSTTNLRLQSIDTAKGLAIILVVLGHVVARQLPAGNEWYGSLKNAIYLFHMPFFMCLSGFVLEYSFRSVASPKEYRDYVRKKFLRIFPAYLAVGLLIVTSKLLVSSFVKVDNVPESFPVAVFNLLVYPVTSGAGFLWYVYVLFVICVLYPAIHRLLARPVLVFGVTFVLNIASSGASEIFMMRSVLEYLVFVCIGALLAVRFRRTGALVDGQLGSVCLLIFVALLVFVTGSDFGHKKLVLGILSIPALLWLCAIRGFVDSRLLLQLGKHVFVIYILNTIVIGVVKAVGFKFVGWDGHNFLFYFPVLFLSGLFVPVLLKKYVFARVGIIDKFTN